MGKREVKTKEERLADGMKILLKLRELGVPRDNEGFTETEKIIRRWIEDGLAVTKTRINFYPYDREGLLTLPALAGTEPTFILRLVANQ